MKKLLVLLTVCVLVAALTAPAMAKQEWSFYGSVRIETTVNDVDDEANTQNGANQFFDDADLFWDSAAQGGSRFGAWSRGDVVSGRIEADVTGWGARLYYGIWHLGWANLIFGQTYQPAAQFISGQSWYGELGLLGLGAVYASRDPQIKLEVPFTNGTFEFAAIRPATEGVPAALTAADIDGTVDTDVWMPKLEAELAYKFGPLAFELHGGWQSYDYEANVVNNQTANDYDVDAYWGGAVVKFSMGPFYANLTGHWAENPRSLGILDPDQLGIDAANGASAVGLGVTWDAVTQSINDVEEWGGAIAVGFRVNDMLAFEAGYGLVDQERDNHSATNGVQVGDEWSAWYVQASITPVKGIKITPEVGQVDFEEAEIFGQPDVDEGDLTYYGIEWKVDF
jgi:hypothetical protein